MAAVQQSGNREVAEKNGTNVWQVVIMGGAVMLTLASQFWTLANPRDDLKQLRDEIKSSIGSVDTRTQEQIRQLRLDLDKEIAKNAAELTETRNELQNANEKLRKDVVSVREHDEFVKREDARLNSLESGAVKLQDNLVTRAEHQTHWNETDQKFTNLGNRLDQLANQLISASSIGDQLKAIQNQIDQLRTIQAGAHANVTLPLGGTLPAH